MIFEIRIGMLRFYCSIKFIRWNQSSNRTKTFVDPPSFRLVHLANFPKVVFRCLMVIFLQVVSGPVFRVGTAFGGLAHEGIKVDNTHAPGSLKTAGRDVIKTQKGVRKREIQRDKRKRKKTHCNMFFQFPKERKRG